ncbi:MAG: histidine kinase [Dermatophilaceae bacterium]
MSPGPGDRTPAVAQADDETRDRLRRLVSVNAVGLGGSVVALTILAVTRVHDANLYRDIGALAAGFLLVASGLIGLRRGLIQMGALSVVGANWLVAAALTWFNPFTLPIAVLAVIAPVVLVFDVLRRRTLAAVIVATVLGAGALTGAGENRRLKPDALQPDSSLTVPIVAVFVAVVALVIVAGLREQVRRLRQQTADLDASRRRLAVAGDEARQAIERDLHDGAQQRLARLSVEMGRVTRLGERDATAAIAELPRLQAELVDGIRELRDLAHGIYPALLADRGLGAALPAAARRTSRPCSVDVAPDARYPAPVEAALYFCAVEAIQNADTHSGASRIDIRVRPVDARLEFDVRDDGRGFDVGTAYGLGRGVTGMADRLRAAGGECLVRSTPGSGTVVSGWLPV